MHKLELLIMAIVHLMIGGMLDGMRDKRDLPSVADYTYPNANVQDVTAEQIPTDEVPENDECVFITRPVHYAVDLSMDIPSVDIPQEFLVENVISEEQLSASNVFIRRDEGDINPCVVCDPMDPSKCATVYVPNDETGFMEQAECPITTPPM